MIGKQMKVQSAWRVVLSIAMTALAAIARAESQVVDGVTWCYSISAGKVTIVSGSIGYQEDLKIPSSLAGCPVTGIGEKAFGWCDMTSVTIPEGVVRIEREAFYGCSKLTSVKIPKSVTYIGVYALSACRSLTLISVASNSTTYDVINGLLCSRDGKTVIAGVNGAGTIPNGVTSIREGAFYNCSGLGTVTIPEGVQDIGECAFFECRGLRSITIPSTVTSIGEMAFDACYDLASVTMSKGVLSIGSMAFDDCDALMAVTIPSSVTSIGSGAFSGCSRLTEISVEPDNKAYASMDGILYNKSKTELIQCPCGKKDVVSIPSGVKIIGSYAFRDCDRLTMLTIPSGVTDIGFYAFNCCNGLTSVKIPASVTSIGAGAFAGAFSNQGGMTEILVDSNNKTFSSLDGILYNKTKTDLIQCPVGKTGSVTIPVSVTNIWREAFCNCRGLTSVRVPSGVKSVGIQAFMNCDGLKSVAIPEGVTSIPYGVFYGCRGLTSMILPSSLKAIGMYAFADCSDLTSVEIPFGVTEICSVAFEGCDGLKSMMIPASVTSIGYRAFTRCSSLRTIRVCGESDEDVVAVRDMFVVSGFDVSEANFCLYDMRYAVFAENVYDGLISNASSNFVGVVQVKLSKQNDNTGVVTATATVRGANGATWSYAGGKVDILSAPSGAAPGDAVGSVTGLKCSATDCPVARFDVVLDGNALDGDWGGNAIVGTRHGGGGEDDPMAEVLERCKGKWSVTLGQRAGAATTLRLQLNVQANAVVSVAGNWESGGSVSVTAQVVVLDDVAYVPVILKATKTTPALIALMKVDGGDLTLVSALDPTYLEAEPYQLVAGGRTTSTIAISGYQAEDPVPVGVDYAGRVVINELAYPAKFTQKGLPTGLKLDVATGVVSGKPSKPGVYDVTFSATSAANSKSNDTCKVVIHVSNYADPEIAVADSYGPYTPGVSCMVEIPEANGCTVSGLPSGLKWTAKEIRAKDGTLTAAANSVYGIPTKPGSYTVYFKKKIAEVNDKGKTVKVEHVSTSTFVVADYPTIAIGPVLASDGIDTEIPLASGTNLVFVVGVAQSVALNLAGTLDGVATTVTAKGLPSGLKLVKTAVYVDPGAKKKVVDHYEYTIEGAPTSVSKVNSKTKTVTPSHVTLSASNKYKWNGAFAFDVTVVALPSWAVGNFSGMDAAPDGSYHGTVTLTVGKTGKISGKIAAQGTNWTYSAAAYAGWAAAGTTNFIVKAVAKSGKRERQVALALAGIVRNEPIPGIFEATATGSFGSDGADLRRIVWKDAGGKVLASEYAGAYTYVDEAGSVYSIAVADSGTVKLAGRVDGKNTTLSTSLLTDLAEDGGMAVVAAFYKAPAKSSKTLTPEFYRFVEIQNWHSEPIAGGVATRNPGAVLSVDETWSGSGKVSASPKYGQTDIGKPVTLTASPDSKSLFVKWVVVDAKGNVVPGDPYAKKFKYAVGEEDVFVKAVFAAKADEPAEPIVLNADAVREAFATCAVGVEVDVSLEIPDEARPVTFSAKNLPSGLKLDAATGRLTGVPRQVMSKDVEITLKTQRGSKPSTKFSFTCVVGSDPQI